MFQVTTNLLPRLAKPMFRMKAIRSVPISTTATRHASGGEMLEVGPWPRTKEERDRAAKKYNLIPEDYMPFDEDDALGDYPNLKAIGAFNRDKYDDFDDPVDMRFYGEVFHKDADLYYWERADPLAHEKNTVPVWLKALIFFGVAGFLPVMKYLMVTYKIEINHPWKQRKDNPPNHIYYQFPSSGTHTAHH